MKKQKKSNTKPLSLEEKKDTSPRVFQREKINYTLNLKGLDWTEKQKAFIELALHKDTKIIFLSGPSGTSKSLLSMFCALELLNEKKISDILYVRTIVESASNPMGILPGDAGEKLHFFASVMNDKLEELLPAGDIKRLKIEERIKAMPVNYLRGASYNAKAIILDEFQNATIPEIVTAITRIGKFTKYFILGDPMQTDIKNKTLSGFKTLFDVFNDEESREKGIFCVEFGKEDIMRSEILKFIIEKLQIYESNKP
jgi:phosphate starvation-inducible protein PhoH